MEMKNLELNEKILQVIEELKRVNISNKNYLLNRIYAGKYILSIQGSQNHYSSPRLFCDLEEYSSMEMAIFKKNGDWLYTTKSSTIRAFKKYDELITHSNGGGHECSVFAYVPIELINELYIYLKTK